MGEPEMDILTLTYPLNAVLMIGIPIGVGYYLTRRFAQGWGIWFLGVVTFLMAQIGSGFFTRAVNGLLADHAAAWPPLTQIIFDGLFLGLSAALWEEGIRYAVLRWWAKDVRSWKDGVMMGAGHGGAMAIVLGVFALFYVSQMFRYRNADLSTLVPAEQLEYAQLEVQRFWSQPWYFTLLNALDSISFLMVNIGLAALVMRTFLEQRSVWFFLAIVLHFVIASGRELGMVFVGPYWTEALLFLAGGLCLIPAFWRREENPANTE
jgi:uncharacterized membrane protein YhfC